MLKIFDAVRSIIPSMENLPAIFSASSEGPGVLFGALGTIAVSLFGLSMGRTRAIISLLSLYIAFVIKYVFPFGNSMNAIGGSVPEHWLNIGIFAGSYIIVFVILSLSLIKKRLSSMEFSLIGIIILGFLQLGLGTSIIFNTLPADMALRWSFGFYKFIATPTSLFFWAIMPLPVLLFIKK